MARTSPLFFPCSAITATLLVALGGCSSDYSVPSNAGGGDAGGGGGQGDGGGTQNSDGGGGTDASQPPIVWPDDFPAHFPGLRPAAALTDLGAICAIDTSALTYTPCGNGAGPKSTPNLFQIPTAPNVAAFFFDHVSFANNVKVTGARALVVVAGRDVSVVSLFDASANLTASGPGADALVPVTGPGKPADSGGNENGGGGGGHGTAGANGAFSAAGTVTTNRGIGGASYGDSTKLVGGARGGGGNIISQNVCGEGGGGGGALQLSALGDISVVGQVLAGGGGGSGGCLLQGAGHGGAGGGSGGMIYLESRGAINLTGVVAANGGGGGSGGGANNAMGVAGQNGQASAAFAFGGPGTGNAGPGGTGGAKDPPTTPSSGLNAGGGGGAAGAIYLSAAKSNVTGIVSPSPLM